MPPGVGVEDLMQNQARFASLLQNAPDAPVEDIKAAVAASREWRTMLISLKESAASLLTDVLPLCRHLATFDRETACLVKAAAAVGAALAGVGAAGVAAGVTFTGLA